MFPDRRAPVHRSVRGGSPSGGAAGGLGPAGVRWCRDPVQQWLTRSQSPGPGRRGRGGRCAWCRLCRVLGAVVAGFWVGVEVAVARDGSIGMAQLCVPAALLAKLCRRSGVKGGGLRWRPLGGPPCVHRAVRVAPCVVLCTRVMHMADAAMVPLVGGSFKT